MNRSAFTQDELKEFQSVLQAASDQAVVEGLDTPIELMAARLFKAAEAGLRDAETLKSVALGKEAWPPTGEDGEGPLIDPATLAIRA